MRGLKISGVFAACGFILSFVAGLFSHTSILSVLIKALIFAVVFGILGYGIALVFKVFLSDGTSTDFQSNGSESVSMEAAPSSGLGQNVDITIQDEELQKSESDNHFVLGESHQMLNDSDVKTARSTAAPESSPGFVPLRNFETVQNFSGTESESPVAKVTNTVMASENVAAADNSAVNNSRPAAAPAGAGVVGLDTLPDMEGFSFGESGSDSDDDDVPVSGSDSEFVSMSKSNKEEPEVKDAALMAKAISSVLSDENSL